MKKLSVILALIMVCTLIPVVSVAADAGMLIVDHVRNGGFESVSTADNTMAADWNKLAGVNVALSSAYKYAESNSLRIANTTSSVISINQRIYNLVPGQVYEISFMYAAETANKNIITQFVVRNDAGETITVNPEVWYNDKLENTAVTGTDGFAWGKISHTFTAPERADQGQLYIYVPQNTTVYIDEVKFMGAVDVEQDCVIEQRPAGAENLIKHDFDSVGKNLWLMDSCVSVTEESGRGYIAKIENSNATENPTIRYTFTVEEGALYQITCDIKTENISGTGPRFKVEYPQLKGSGAEQQSPVFKSTFGTWQTVGAKFRVPAGVTKLSLLIRLYGTGTMCVDNADAYKIGEVKKMNFGASAFNYTDTGFGMAYAHANTNIAPIVAGSKVSFQLLDTETVIDSLTENTKEEIIYNFPIAGLSEDKEYTVRISYLSADNTVLETEDFKVCRTQRPSRIDKNGYFTGYNGQKILPVMGYHVNGDTNTEFAAAAAAGINVVQYNPGGNITSLKNALTAAKANNVYLAVVLYDNGSAAGADKNINRTTAIVNACKDDEGIFAWMVQDEPLWNDPYCYPVLYDSYKLIHSLDKKNPVYICESSEEKCIDMAGVCDILGSDPYPSNLGVNRVGDVTRSLSSATRGIKPLLNILQCYDTPSELENGYKPDTASLRQMAYQGFFMGATNVGYYPVSEVGQTPIRNEDFFPAVESINLQELTDAHGAFVLGEAGGYKNFAEKSSISEDVWYKLYIKNNELYLIAINRATEERSFSVPLQSGSVTIGEFNATAVDISGSKAVSGTGTFSLTLPSLSAVKYKIEPKASVDFEDIDKTTVIAGGVEYTLASGEISVSDNMLTFTNDTSAYTVLPSGSGPMIAEILYKTDDSDVQLTMGYTEEAVPDASSLSKENTVNCTSGTWQSIKLGYTPGENGKIILNAAGLSGDMYFKDLKIYEPENIAEYATNGNTGFENGTAGYHITGSIASSVSTEQKAEGESSLKIPANYLSGIAMEIKTQEMGIANEMVKVSFKLYGAGTMQFYADNIAATATGSKGFITTCTGTAGKWTEVIHYVNLSNLNGYFRIRVTSASSSVYIDDIKITKLDGYGEVTLRGTNEGCIGYENLKNPDKVSAYAQFVNPAGEDISAKAIVAKYKGNQMTEVKIYSLQASDSGAGTKLGDEITLSESEYVKVFFWDENIKPLADARSTN